MAVFKLERCPQCRYQKRSVKLSTPGVCPKCSAEMAYSESWYISYYKGGRERLEAVGKSKRLAEAVEAKKKTEIIEGKHLDKAADCSWHEAVKKFRTWFVTNTKPKTARMYENSLKILAAHFGDYSLSQIDAEKVEKFKQIRLETVTNSTVNRDIATLKRLYALMCDEWHLIPNNPMHAVKKLKENPSRMRFLTADEETKLLSACYQRKKGPPSRWLGLAVLTALNTGMRKEAITSLKKSEIDFSARFIRAATKGGKTTSVPINDILYAALTDYLLEQKKEEDKSGIVSLYLFPSPRDARKPIREDIHKGFDTACRMAGIEDFRFHDLRHTFARNFYKRTHDWKSLSMILNHSSVAITMAIYVNFDDNDLTEAMKAFEAGRV